MRIKKSFYNVAFSLLSYFISMIFTFVTQAMIVKILGIEYSGVNGLFNNILTMLSVAELGIGTAIIFKLYDPISKDNREEIKSWMNFYKICYRFVALFVLLVGLLILPLVPAIIGSSSIKDNLYILYFISLLDVIFSYIMTYKRSLLYADQKNYVINIVHILYTVFMNLFQIIIIFFTKKYLYYLIVKVIFRLLENIIINSYVNLNYPYINEKYLPISKSDRRDISERIQAIFVQKVSFVVNKGIDNILISIFLGVSSVGFYTNYNLIVTTLSSTVFQMISGFSASIGNLLTENNKEKNYLIYKVVNLFNTSMTSLCICGFFCCIQPFITIWLGHDYLLSLDIVISFVIYLYSDSIRRSITIFKEAAGICKEDKHAYIFMTLINLFSSIILCRLFGISGVIVGTSISYLYLIFYSYPKFVFTKVFTEPIYFYYIEKIKNIFLITISLLLSFYLCNLFSCHIIFKFIFNGIIASFVTFILLIVVYRKSDEFIYLRKLINKLILKKIKQFKRS